MSPCATCGAPVAPRGWRVHGFFARLEERQRRYLWTCEDPACIAQAEARKAAADARTAVDWPEVDGASGAQPSLWERVREVEPFTADLPGRSPQERSQAAPEHSAPDAASTPVHLSREGAPTPADRGCPRRSREATAAPAESGEHPAGARQLSFWGAP